MTKLEVQLVKLRKSIKVAVQRKHGNDTQVSVSLEHMVYDSGSQSDRTIIHVWRNHRIVTSYYPETVRMKEIIQYIRHTQTVFNRGSSSS